MKEYPVISRTKIFGITIFKRLRKTEKQIDIYRPETKYSFSGLTPIVYNTEWIEGRFEKDADQFNLLALQMIRNSFFNLLIQGKIKLTEFYDNTSYLSDWFDASVLSYQFEIIDTSNITDLIERELINSIEIVNYKYKKIADLDKLINVFISKFITPNQFDPLDKLVSSMLHRYCNEVSWISIHIPHNPFKLNYFLLPDISYDKLTLESVNLAESYNKSLQQNYPFRLFSDRISVSLVTQLEKYEHLLDRTFKRKR